MLCLTLNKPARFVAKASTSYNPELGLKVPPLLPGRLALCFVSAKLWPCALRTRHDLSEVYTSRWVQIKVSGLVAGLPLWVFPRCGSLCCRPPVLSASRITVTHLHCRLISFQRFGFSSIHMDSVLCSNVYKHACSGFAIRRSHQKLLIQFRNSQFTCRNYFPLIFA